MAVVAERGKKKVRQHSLSFSRHQHGFVRPLDREDAQLVVRFKQAGHELRFSVGTFCAPRVRTD